MFTGGDHDCGCDDNDDGACVVGHGGDEGRNNCDGETMATTKTMTMMHGGAKPVEPNAERQKPPHLGNGR
eukprot:2691857-Pyramimonas_sp.AAC.1